MKKAIFIFPLFGVFLFLLLHFFVCCSFQFFVYILVIKHICCLLYLYRQYLLGTDLYLLHPFVFCIFSTCCFFYVLSIFSFSYSSSSPGALCDLLLAASLIVEFFCLWQFFLCTLFVCKDCEVYLPLVGRRLQRFGPKGGIYPHDTEVCRHIRKQTRERRKDKKLQFFLKL